MEDGYATVAIRLAAAVIAGGVIGLERSYRGRTAGFRTHVLVCTASCLLMLFMEQQWRVLDGTPLASLRMDPTRMAQGIMTGIGFLGAGVIMKEHFTIRGLTTAASIWMTAAIGIIVGSGFYYAAALVTALALGTLAGFRWLEATIPTYSYGRLMLCTGLDRRLTRAMLFDLLRTHGLRGGDVSYRADAAAGSFEYQLSVHTHDEENFARLADTLCHMTEVREFSITPAGN